LLLHRRYEVLLPLRYNDGTPVESVKFGDVTVDTQPMIGYWRDPGGEIYVNQVIRLAVDVPDTPENRDFFVQWKETLKERLRQVEIWIVAISLEVI